MPSGRPLLLFIAIALLAPSLASNTLHAQKTTPDSTAAASDTAAPLPAP